MIKETTPLLSIVTVVRNGVLNIEETLVSVLSKTPGYQFEYIVIDGGSTDGTVDIINKYSGRIDHFISEKDNGIYDAMNKGLELAKGVWINFMNSGDILIDLPDLSKFNSNVLVYGSARLYKKKRLKVKKCLSFSDFSGGMAVCHQACFYKTEKLKKIKYDISYKICGDQKATAEILKKGDAKYVDLIVVDYDYTGISTRSSTKIFREKLRLNREIGFSIFPILWSTFRDILVKFREFLLKISKNKKKYF
jgi:glycosyltransferase involved in cell wall biosynthesis